MLGTALALVPLRAESIAELRRAAELRPTGAVYNTLGMALARFGEYDLAREVFERAIKLNPKLADAYLNLGLLLAEKQQFSDAQKQIVEALALNRDPARAGYLHFLNGRLLDELGKSADAAKEFTEATKLQPGNADSWIGLGRTRQALGQHQEAATAFAKAVSLAPQNPDAYLLLGQEYLTLGQAEKAIEPLRRARELLPHDRGALLSLTRALREAGQTKEAGELSRELAKMSHSQPTPDQLKAASDLNTAGTELEKAGDLNGALAKYRQSLEIDADNKITRRNWALALCRLGRWDEGIKELRALVEQYPDDLDTRKMLYTAIEQAERDGTQKESRKPN